MTKTNYQTKTGFTLVEIMVAVSIFSIVTVIVVGALITAIAINNKAQAIKLAMDNLNYALDSISVKMKRGYNFEFSDEELTFISPKDDPENEPKTYTYKLNNSAGTIEMQVDGGPWRAITITQKLKVDRFFGDITIGNPGPFSRGVIVIRGSARVGSQEQKFAVQTAVTERP